MLETIFRKSLPVMGRLVRASAADLIHIPTGPAALAV